jgi:peptide deformylase
LSDSGLLPILDCGDPILRRIAEPVDPDDLEGPALQLLVARMRATMEAAPGVGLAAPQVGVGLRIAVVEDGPDRWRQLGEEERVARERTALPFSVLVNPVLEPVDDDDLVAFYEGCLSVPGLTGVVARYRTVRVRALDQYGQSVDTVLSGWPARIAQHEVDHLHGCLYLDRVETRSLSTTENYARRWAGRSPADAADGLGFALPSADARTQADFRPEG